MSETPKPEGDQFKKLTKPTIQQVRTVWESMSVPSFRACAELMERRGFKISFGTVGRYFNQGWMSAADAKKARLAERAKAAEKEIAKISEAEKAGAALAMAEVFPTIDELKALPAVDLQVELKRQVMVTSIVGLQVAAKKAEQLVAISPKDFGNMVAELASAISMARIVENAKTPFQPGDDATVIEGKVLDVPPAPPKQEVSAVVASLDRLRAMRANGSNG